jgi:6-phosphogluconolactonase
MTIARDAATGLPGTVAVFKDADALAASAAAWVANACAATNRFDIALAGGSTPRRLYERLAQPPYAPTTDWSRWHVWFGDERAVPPSHEASNFRMARASLLEHVRIPAAQIHRSPADDPDLERGARRYREELRSSAPMHKGMPHLDVVLLGLGDDGHTASLFPGDSALAVTDRSCTPGYAVQEPRQRLTLTFPAINAAKRVAFLVTGDGKAAALRGVVAGTVPASRVHPTDGELVWFLDSAAAHSIE